MKHNTPTVWHLLGVLLLVLLVYSVLENDVIHMEGGTFEVHLLSLQPKEQSRTEDIQVFFTTPTLVYPDIPKRRVAPPFEQALVADMDAARYRIHMVAFEYNLMSVADALLRAHQRGVEVRLALDHECLEKPEQALWAGKMQMAGIPIAWQETSAFLHSKFAVIDNTVVWMGSWNFTVNGTYRNNNNLLRMTIPPVVENYAVEAAQMVTDERFGTNKRVLTPNPVVVWDDAVMIETYFSPQDGAMEHVLDRIYAARHSIHFISFSYTSDDIGLAMVEQHHMGVHVQGIFESRNARGLGSEFALLKEAGVDVVEDGNCYTMHHKVIVIDEATVITGSYNFTNRAENVNDENLVIIDDPLLAAHYLEEFERVYMQAQKPTRCQR